MQGAKLSNMKNLIEWIKQSNLDPYDPENAFLLNLMKVGGNLNQSIARSPMPRITPTRKAILDPI